jgi:hypothetical protein
VIDLKCKSIVCLAFLEIFKCIKVATAETTYDLSAGDRTDKLNFNVAGDINDRSFLEGSVGYGLIHSGHNQDSDYATENRTGMFSRSENNDGNIFLVLNRKMELIELLQLMAIYMKCV